MGQRRGPGQGMLQMLQGLCLCLTSGQAKVLVPAPLRTFQIDRSQRGVGAAIVGFYLCGLYEKGKHLRDELRRPPLEPRSTLKETVV